MKASNTDSHTDSCTATTRIPEAKLLGYLHDFAAELGRVPRVRDMKRRGRYSDQTYYNRFQSWEAALEKAGLHSEFEHSKYNGGEYQIGKLVDELVSVAVEVGRPPTGADMDEHGQYTHSIYQNTFGSWAEALRTCGFPPRYQGGTSRPPTQQRPEYGMNWDEQRRRALFRDGYQCQHCGVKTDELDDYPQAKLQVHHIVPIRRFDTPELGNHLLNLVTLCPPCHRMWESTTPQEIDVDELVAEIRTAGDIESS